MNYCKPKKNVCILSFLHLCSGIDSAEKKKPETVRFRNKTECSVDVADQMACQYCIKGGTRAVFCMLDLACTNAISL